MHGHKSEEDYPYPLRPVSDCGSECNLKRLEAIQREENSLCRLLFQSLVNTGNADRQDSKSQREERCGLGPELAEADPFEEDAADDD